MQFSKKAILGDRLYRDNNYEKFKLELNNQLILFLGLNEMRKTKSMEKTIENLKKKISKYEARDNEQKKSIQSVQHQIDTFNQSPDIEKEQLLTEYTEMCVITPERSLTGSATGDALVSDIVAMALNVASTLVLQKCSIM